MLIPMFYESKKADRSIHPRHVQRPFSDIKNLLVKAPKFVNVAIENDDDVVEAGRWKSDAVDAACHKLQPCSHNQVMMQLLAEQGSLPNHRSPHCW